MKVYPARLISKVWEVMQVSVLIFIIIYTIAFYITSSRSSLAEAIPKLLFIIIIMILSSIIENLAHRSIEVTVYPDRVGVYQEKEYFFKAKEFEFEFKYVSRILLKVGYRSWDYAVIFFNDGRRLMIHHHSPNHQKYDESGGLNLLEVLAREYNSFNERNNIHTRADVRTAKATTNEITKLFLSIVDVLECLDSAAASCASPGLHFCKC